ncbi:hypothetical protein BIV57_12090 [Mangrovactinospora gilvigrisea]|uniref:Gram-positive cocci surface proteins LPxTG domain-containing protein n=1 Tax=Mangrovactinospora gilvigrisea TaxID=1428644 RepID=A0A1J7CC65_9ACTN|nr:hypothetical protein BIV57_12090 [Mangrovactinospora gilvigrisea]
MRTALTGLPSKIVAGSGFHTFRLDVRNTGDAAYKSVDLGVFAGRLDADYFVDTRYLTMQFQDPASGRWTPISLAESDLSAGYLGSTGIRPHESFSVKLRLAVSAAAPAGQAFAFTVGIYADGEGNCVYTADEFYEFRIVKAGSPTPPKDDTAKPQGGAKPLPSTKPAGSTKIAPKGTLAETGSNSALPAIGLSAAAAVALGAGTLYTVRRRAARRA